MGYMKNNSTNRIGDFLFLLLLISIGGSSISCLKEVSINNELTTLKVENFTHTNKVSILFSRIRYVPLSTLTDDSILDEFQKLIIANNRYYILHGNPASSAALSVFGINGEFLLKLQIPYEGPGSALGINDFLINSSHQIEILDHQQKRILVYDENGNYLKTIDTPDRYVRFVHFADGGYGCFKGNFPSESPERVHILTENLKPIEQSLPTDEVSSLFIVSSKRNFGPAYPPNQYLFNTILDPLIYAVSPQGLLPKYHLDFGNAWLEETALEKLRHQPNRRNSRTLVLNKKDHVFNIRTHSENENYFFFSNFYQGLHDWHLYDKKKNSGVTLREQVNDLDNSPIGQLDVWPFFIHGQDLIFILPAPLAVIRLESIAKKQNISLVQLAAAESSAFYPLANQIDENSNPIVVFARLKEDIVVD